MNSENLPAFLRRSPAGRLQLVLHCTQAEDFNVCQLKYQLSHGLAVEKATSKTSLFYGSAIHAALAFRYRHQELSLAEAEAGQIDLLTKLFADRQVFEGDWRNLDRAVQAVKAYNVRWPAHEWTVLGVEEEFEVKVGELIVNLPQPDGMIASPVFLRTPVDVILAGRKDLVAAWYDGIWIVDHKTCSEWGRDLAKNQELKKGRRSFQFRGYAWAERERQTLANEPYPLPSPLGKPIWDESQRARLPVRGAIGNYIVGREPYSESISATARRAKSVSLNPRDDHHQEFFDFTDTVLDEWREECLLAAERILDCWRTGKWAMAYGVACALYGGCDFYDYCEEPPDRREATLSSSVFRAKQSTENDL